MNTNWIISILLFFFLTSSSIIPGYQDKQGDLQTLPQTDPLFKFGLQAVIKYAEVNKGLVLSQLKILDVKYRLAGGIWYLITFSCIHGEFQSQVFVIIWQDLAEVDSFEQIAPPSQTLTLTPTNLNQENSMNNSNQTKTNSTMENATLEENETNLINQTNDTLLKNSIIQQQKVSLQKQTANEGGQEQKVTTLGSGSYRRLLTSKERQNLQAEKIMGKRTKNLQLERHKNIKSQ